MRRRGTNDAALLVAIARTVPDQPFNAGGVEVRSFIDMRPVRELSAAEVDQIDAAGELTDFLQAKSSYWALRGEHSDVIDAFHRVLVAVGTRQPDSRIGLERFQRRYKSWLAAFRTFADRTQHWVSLQFGKDSDELRDSRALFKAEFDSNFAYRLADQLRNISEHGDQVVNAVRVVSTLGEPAPSIYADIDCRRLAHADAGRRLRAATRHEMLAVKTPLGAGLIAQATMRSCERIYAGTVEILSENIDAAAEISRELRTESQAAENEILVLANAQELERAATEPMSLRQVVHIDDGALAALRASSRQLLARGPLEIQADDLIDTRSTSI